MTGINGKNNSFSQSSKKTIFLVDSTSLEREIEHIKGQEDKITIISFDYESHRNLLKNKINHMISDDFLTESDLQAIQEKSYSLSYWFCQPEIDHFFDYEGINLGQLFQVEFHYLLVPFLKKFVEFSKLFKKFPDSSYIASGTLYEIASSFSSSITRSTGSKEYDSFLYDSVKIPIKIGNKSIQIAMSRRRYLNVKRFVEKLTSCGITSSKGLTSKKSVLLVEFDPLRYGELFLQNSHTSIDFLFYNRRRPAIWNYESYRLIKKTKCRVIAEHDVIDSEHFTINEKIDAIMERIQPRLDGNFFKSFFSIGGYSFWNSIKEAFINLVKKRIIEAIYEIELTKRLFEKYQISSVLVLNEIGFNEQIVIGLAIKKKLPVILIQHGLYYDTAKVLEGNKLGGIFPFRSEKIIVWGKIVQKYMLDNDIPDSKIIQLGSISLDRHFKMRSTLPSRADYVLLSTVSPVNYAASELTVKIREKYEQAIRKICQVFLKLDKKLIIKLHPFSEEVDITNIVKEINPKIQVIKTADFASLAASCETLVAIDYSTSILEAQIFQKPVICVSVKDWDLKTPQIFRYGSCVITGVDEFENALLKILNDSKYKKEIIENANRFLNDYLSNQGNASKKLLMFLEQL